VRADAQVSTATPTPAQRATLAQAQGRGEGPARTVLPVRTAHRLYRLEWPDPDSFSVDHYPRPLSTHPHLAEDPGNLKPAHLRCNQAAGDRGPVPSLGQPSEDW
jgi:hypothetical protein